MAHLVIALVSRFNKERVLTMKKILMSIMLFVVYGTANSTIMTALVSTVECNPGSTTCYLQLTNSVKAIPSCASRSGYAFNGTTNEGKNVLSIALSAKMGGKTVTVIGAGGCIGNTEAVSRLILR